MDAHQILNAWWSTTGAEIKCLRTPEGEIAALENRYGIKLPPDFRLYLQESAPADENWDAEDGNWWPVRRIQNVPEEYDHAVGGLIARNAAKHLFFLDYSIWAWAWAISCADDNTRGKVALIGGQPDGYVANSFGEFVERYTTDWMAISRIESPTKPTSGFRGFRRGR